MILFPKNFVMTSSSSEFTNPTIVSGSSELVWEGPALCNVPYYHLFPIESARLFSAQNGILIGQELL